MTRLVRFSATNLALVYVALSILVLAAFAAPLVYAWRETINEARTDLLQADARRLTALFDRGGAAAVATAIDAQVGPRPAGEKVIVFTDAAFARLAGNLPRWPVATPTGSGPFDLAIDLGGSILQGVFVRADLPDGHHLLVGRDIARFRTLETLFKFGLAGAATIVLVIGILGALAIRQAFLSELHGVNRTTAAIVGGDLSHRLAVGGRGDEFDLLAGTINRLLDQIEQLVRGVRNVSNAIAHDLRTPLAELRSRLEELSYARPDSDETFAEVDAAVADVDRVLGIFNALLRLAEIESGARRSGFRSIDVAQVASEATDFYQPLAEDRQVRLDFAAVGPTIVVGDPLLVAQAVGNLVDNALKYVPEHSTIVVAVAAAAHDGATITVSDDGPGIPVAEHARVTERFYRGDASRGTPGVGLGLSLVAAVAKLHDGDLALEDNRPGLRVTLRLSGASRP